MPKITTGAFAPRHNYSATTDPGATDDSSKQYAIGSQWINTATDALWTCMDATAGAAEWVEAGTGGPGGVTSHGALTGLGADDHTQYHTDARGDARYAAIGHLHGGVYLPTSTRLDQLAPASDNTTLNVSTGAHGLAPKLPGIPTQYLDGTGAWSSPGGGGGALDNLSDVAVTAPAINQTLLFDGANWVNAAPGTSFSFSVSSFSDGISTAQLIGPDLNTWRAAGAMTFSAAYSNGPATEATVQIISGHEVWSSALTLAGTTGPTVSAEAVTYPSGPNVSITFRVTASKGATTATRDESVYFNNIVYWGHLNKASGYTEADVEGLATTVVLTSNTRARTIAFAPTAGQYCVYAYPSRLGVATFTVNGFPGGFDTEETVSITNANGYTEDYYVRVSDNPSLSAFSAVVT